MCLVFIRSIVSPFIGNRLFLMTVNSIVNIALMTSLNKCKLMKEFYRLGETKTLYNTQTKNLGTALHHQLASTQASSLSFFETIFIHHNGHII